MIQNITDLAKEVGSRASNPDVQKQDILASVRKHTDGDAWVSFTSKHVDIRSNISPAHDRLFYPFTSEDFWKTVEFIQEEGLEWEEDNDEDIYAPQTYHQWRLQEQYD